MIDAMFPEFKTMMNSSEPEARHRVPGPDGDEFSHLSTSTAWSACPSYVEWLLRVRHARDVRVPPSGCSNCCSGTASRTCGTCGRRCTCSPSTPSSRRTRMRNSCGAIVIRPRCWGRCAASSTTSGAGAATATTRRNSAPNSSAWWAEHEAGDGLPQGFGDDRFVDVSFADLQTDSVNTVAAATSNSASTSATPHGPGSQRWADEHKPGHARRAHLRARGLRADGRAGARGVRRVPGHLRRIGVMDDRRGRQAADAGSSIRTRGCASPSSPLRRKSFARRVFGRSSVAQVLARAQLGTRAFYRHFESEGPTGGGRLPRDGPRGDRAAPAARWRPQPDPVRRGRGLDRRAVGPGLRRPRSGPICVRCRSEAQSQMFASPEVVGAAYGEILTPLVEQLERGCATGHASRRRPGRRRTVGTRRAVGERRKAMGDRRLRSLTCVGVHSSVSRSRWPRNDRAVLEDDSTHFAAMTAQR